VELLEQGHEVTVIDNLSNSSQESLRRVEKLTGKSVDFHNIDLCDRQAVEAVFANAHFDAVIHFAGFKAVGESVNEPLLYYRNNLDSTLTLCEVMEAHNIRQLVFSSSATVYDATNPMPLTETSILGGANPYGRTKLMIEEILRDLAVAKTGWQINILRYFNPVGAHPSGQIGEDPNGPPNNLLPFVTQVAVGRRAELHVFGDDYDTPDGTGVRDYIHVTDLVKGHLAALQHMPAPDVAEVYNLGTGKGSSVLELVHAFEKVSGKTIPYKVVARRPGDLGTVYADVGKAARVLGWRAELSLEQACADSWRWQLQNPDGFNV
jgi:UDP-glucose 4-epimerase